MTTFMDRIGVLVSNLKTLCYVTSHGERVRVIIQPVAKLDKINADPATRAKLNGCGVDSLIVIGTTQTGVPVIMDLNSQKTYLLDSEGNGMDYLKNEVNLVW